jgi:glucose/mannose transport system substrate-binding protein
MQIHGDWMKGEWLAAGKVPGEDFGCIEIPGAEAVSVTVDSFGLLGGQSPEKDAAELDFARVVLDPEVQAEFAAQKGSTPVRLDAAQGEVDVCSQYVLNVLDDPARQVPSPHSTVDADWMSSMWDVLFNYWSDPEMTADEAIAQMQENYETILADARLRRLRRLRAWGRRTFPLFHRRLTMAPKDAPGRRTTSG